MVDSSSSASAKQQRFSEKVKFLPVVFVWFIIISLYVIYTWLHAVPLLEDPQSHTKGLVHLISFNIISALLITCYLACILLHPGSIPDKEEDPSWEYIPRDGVPGEQSGAINLLEAKRSGDRRHCKWCAKYKPDRCHHCRVCRMCILKMDHHCPWIYNCVGFNNHKYFFLLLLYSAIDLHFITWTMIESLKNSVAPSTPFVRMFLVLFGETLAGFLGILVTVFWGFHIWLMLKATTTIEFCEKQMKQTGGFDASAYDRGVFGNMKAVLGENVFTWFLPFDPPTTGNGLCFLTEDMKLTKDMEVGRGVRRRAHQLGDDAGGYQRQRSSSSAHPSGEEFGDGDGSC